MDRSEQARLLGQLYPEVAAADPVAFFSEVGDPAEALVYGWLFWPDLVEIEGAVFLVLWGDAAADIAQRVHEPVADGHPDWAPMSWAEAVDSHNFFEVAHLFRRVRGPVETWDTLHEELAGFLVRTWGARLASAYPDRRFTVRTAAAGDGLEFRIQVTQVFPTLTTPPGWDSARRGIIR